MVTLKEIELAHDRIRSFIHRTPILTNKSLNELSGASLYFKCENFQKVGAFKIRGATNTVEQLSQAEIEKGVATTSSGNHGAALSMAVTRRGGKTKVVMPNNTPKIKLTMLSEMGAKWCGVNRNNLLEKVYWQTLLNKPVPLLFIRTMMSALWPGREHVPRS